ncbi:DUF167 family protein [Enterovirga sp.]|jgi:uncharacterized protein YggU (UPF0235/DUF167 family)|uniref:DUF167 family protein n=1 Tax=Enterovirga sp. TaxID=2026350 RepID=UPI00262C6021|nr:DUF167 family protein [Enterovirga sp.]MDB5592694.1 hypothetical protein [Enterovirga sp.]
MRAWREVEGGVSLRIRVTPRGGCDRLDGVALAADGSAHLKLRVRTAPEAGAANEAARRLLARSLDLPASAVRLASGATSRAKVFELRGEPSILGRRLLEIVAA